MNGSKTLSVLILSPDPAVPGGVSHFIQMLKDHLVHCAVTSLYVGTVPYQKKNGVAVIKRLLSMLAGLVKLVTRNHFDVIHINPSLNTRSLLRDGMALLILRLLRQKHILVFFHGWNGATEQKITSQRWMCRIFVWLLDTAKVIMVLAPDFRTSLIAMGIAAEKIMTGTTMFDESAIRINFQQHPTERNILFMARFEKEKGMYELLEAFRAIAEEFPDTTLVFAGDGRETMALQKEVDKLKMDRRILLAGHVQGEAKTALLADSAIFVLPTRYGEGMPVAILEAMAAGKPVIAGKAGGIASILRDPENGILLETVNASTIAGALRRMLSDPLYCEVTGKHNAEYAWNTFTATRVTTQIETLYYALSA